MAIIKKEIVKDPEVKFLLEETGELHSSEEHAAEALKDWERDKEKRKIDAEISIKLFGAKWIQYYGKNKLVLPQYCKDCNWYKEGRHESFEDYAQYVSAALDDFGGIIDFGSFTGYERLFNKLISNGVILEFDGSIENYCIEPKDIKKFTIGCKHIKNEWGYTINPKVQNLRMAAYHSTHD